MVKQNYNSGNFPYVNMVLKFLFKHSFWFLKYYNCLLKKNKDEYNKDERKMNKDEF